MYYDDYRDLNEFDDLDEFDNMDEYEYEEFQPPYFCPFYQQNLYGYRQFPSPPPFPPGIGGPSTPMGPQPGGAPMGAPTAPPPNFTPSKPQAHGGISALAIDPGAIRRCRFRYVYIWPVNGRGFWAWLTFVGRRSIAGFRWNGRRWVYFGLDLRRIESFQCF